MPPSFFSDRSNYISSELSWRIVGGLRRIGMLDAAGMVTTDPRYTTKAEGAAGAGRGCCRGCLSLVWAEGAASRRQLLRSRASNPVRNRLAPPSTHPPNPAPPGTHQPQPWKAELQALLPELTPETTDSEGLASHAAMIGGAPRAGLAAAAARWLHTGAGCCCGGRCARPLPSPPRLHPCAAAAAHPACSCAPAPPCFQSK